MIDFANIEKYKENNRIEAKKSLGGFPKSLWETYSAFANTLGGVILLGVEERRDKSFHAIDLPDPDGLINEFWSIVNNPNKVSVNILSKKDVTVETYEGKHIVAIRVPRAQRSDKPVYIDGSPLTGTYRRSGEGDYRCEESEIRAMLRDADRKTQDMRVLKGMGIESLDLRTVRRYRSRLKGRAVRGKLGNAEFLNKIGALEFSDGEYRLTSAGLLMFGYEREIVKEYPDYFLEYRDGYSNVIASNSGRRSGNVFDFYFAVSDKITKKIDSEGVKSGLREAFTNSLINADYYGKSGIKVISDSDKIIFSNPGRFRIDIDAAMLGGISDPRNGALTKMFKLLDIGEGTGSGIPNIFKIWKDEGLPSPMISECFNPDRITFTLPLSSDAFTVRSEYKHEPPAAVRSVKTALIIEYLTEKISASEPELARYAELKLSHTREYLSELAKKGIVVYEGRGRKRIYRLKG